MATNGIPILAQALQAHLARKHQAGMWAAEDQARQQRQLQEQENFERGLKRRDIEREQDLAMLLEDRANRMAMDQQHMALEARKMDAQSELEKAKLEAEREMEQYRAQQRLKLEEFIQGKLDERFKQGQEGMDRRHATPRPKTGVGPRTTKDHIDTYLRTAAALEAQAAKIISGVTHMQTPEAQQAAKDAAKRLWDQAAELRKMAAMAAKGQAPDAQEPGQAQPHGQNPETLGNDYFTG